ncbi:MAG: aminomethyl-transferring glycine dehydrogenase [Bacteroidales bacterium]|nr:aminomethyl-transferring glycine dehydrogenase [Bacteroidales bacterium]
MIREDFYTRHIGPRESEYAEMLKKIGAKSLDQFIDQVVPKQIRLKENLKLDAQLTEDEFLVKLKAMASKNKIYRSLIGMGYYGTAVPSVVLRNVFENPSWYTSYTPYQAEISQGRLEALLNFQTMLTELTGMELANCSLLDEGTAAAEAARMMFESRSRQAAKEGRNVVFVDADIFPQTLDVILMRAEPLGIEIEVGDFKKVKLSKKYIGAILQYPTASGEIRDYSKFTEEAHANEMLVTAVADIMSLVLLKSPASWGADIVVGNTQRFGVPMGFGGPHAAYMATSDKYKRKMPGRIIGVSVDKFGRKALRLALQTREQHIKREDATSNICTAQALLAMMAGFYAVYHGPEGLKRIATNIHSAAKLLAGEIKKLGYKIANTNFFDTVVVSGANCKEIEKLALQRKINFHYIDEKTVGFSTDEIISLADINNIIEIFAIACGKEAVKVEKVPMAKIDSKFARTDSILQQKVFNKYQSETEMMRYIKKLENRDISLTQSMISLGSCTMKLNPATSMLPLSWPEFANIHPFVPKNQALGYYELIDDISKDLSTITGFAATTLQPNSGATGEHTGLMIIRAYHIAKKQAHRNICIIPTSAHGTNPASMAMAGFKLVLVNCDEHGNIDVKDLKAKAEANKENLGAMMITYPSTHGVFENKILDIVKIIHDNGGLVYMDGANMNAQVALTNPGTIGADVCHLNLHKTFSSPHGGGGPGIGSVSVCKKLADFLPTHTVIKTGGKHGIRAITSAPFGSAMILPITYAYIKMMGEKGLKEATKLAILNANYIASELKDTFEVLYTGETGRCAHEMILNVQNFRAEYGVEAADIAHRLMDFGFHAPTLSFPVHETLMVEPTESESKQELDRFIETMKVIKAECEDIKAGKYTREDNPLVNAPHTQFECTASEWNHCYSREKAAFPLPWIKENKFWPYVAKIDNAYGDRNLDCKCNQLEEE